MKSIDNTTKQQRENKEEQVEVQGYQMNTARLVKAIFQDVIQPGEFVDDSDLLLYF